MQAVDAFAEQVELSAQVRQGVDGRIVEEIRQPTRERVLEIMTAMTAVAHEV